MDRTKGTYAVLLLCFFVGGGAGQDFGQLKYHLQHFTSVRHPAVDGGAREAARSYIKDQFREYGLEVATHSFNTSLLLQGYSRTIGGENVVGVAEGSGKGPVVLIGADYDTTIHHHPLEDNGAGVAAMLEVARNYMDVTGPKGYFDRNRTVIFVAFDLNTKEYNDATAGRPGSYHFLHQWLWPYLNQSVINFGGAIILDSITKFNLDVNTQYLPEGFSEAFPEAFKKVSEDEMKGDFLGLVTRDTSQSLLLTKTFVDNYRKHRKAGLVRLQELVLRTSAPVSTHTMDMINHQAHFHFWGFKPSDKPSALPALLLTDTDLYRRGSEQCPLPCSSEDFLTRRRQQVLSLTGEALIHTLLDLQTERRPGVTGGMSTGSSAVVTVGVTWVMAVLARLIH